MVDGFWTGEYDRWRARFDLLLVLPRPDGTVRVCARELAQRWRWTQRRVRRLVERLVEDGYLLHERRLSRGVFYRLCDALVDAEGISEEEVVEPEAIGVGVDPVEASEAVCEVEGAHVGGDADLMEQDSVEESSSPEQSVPAISPASSHPSPEAPARASPEPKARPSPTVGVLQLGPSERHVAAEVLKCKPKLFDQMLEVWVEFKEVRQRCLSALELPLSGCRLTEKRAFKIIDVLASAGVETVLEAVGNLPYSHWHCGTSRHAASGTKICPEAVFNVQQVQILSEIPDRVPVWEQVGARSPLQQRIDFDGRGKVVDFWRSQDVVLGGPARALGVR